jgi:hypothetical protein
MVVIAVWIGLMMVNAGDRTPACIFLSYPAVLVGTVAIGANGDVAAGFTTAAVLAPCSIGAVVPTFVAGGVLSGVGFVLTELYRRISGCVVRPPPTTTDVAGQV